MFVALKSEDFDPERRVDAFQSAAENICKLQITPAEDREYRSQTMIAVLPDLVLADTSHTACTTLRTSELAAETGDNLLIHIPLAGGFEICQRGGDTVACGPGEVYLDPTEVPGIATFAGARANVLYISIPRALVAMAGAVPDTGLRNVTALTPQWRLLLGYVRCLHAELPHLPPEQATHCAAHVHDLAVMALGASRDAAEVAAGRGVRAARLRAVKDDIERNLVASSLSAEWIAARHGISPRYIRALFAGEGTSFGDYVANRRLLMARRMLSDPSQAARSISDIALSAGFGDLSWFNARFRRAFAMTPSEVRAQARKNL
ncbi:AraC family transcriptional regulator [Tepidamorphus gemmatus]|uniref:AraC family transcriptional regulator n=1 Tax=Tepidamorphus gemmatus TaxID=747076 RepID=A0A4R3MAD7_9HYPH|nr:AraC family transcriptional regulator [Tepidamorphus gemmatus]TCT10554.1 AraC family transcriptional regulator [Tepidamorphus gemmatus]